METRLDGSWRSCWLIFDAVHIPNAEGVKVLDFLVNIYSQSYEMPYTNQPIGFRKKHVWSYLIYLVINARNDPLSDGLIAPNYVPYWEKDRVCF